MNGTDVVAGKIVDRVGVGEIFAVAGQSNAANSGGINIQPRKNWLSPLDLVHGVLPETLYPALGATFCKRAVKINQIC